MEIFLIPDTWMALLTLTFLEIVLGIDNIIFISILVGKLPERLHRKATNLGLLLAMMFRIIMIFGVSLLFKLKKPFWSVDVGWFEIDLSGQGLIMMLGGMFLLYKSTKEIHEKMEGQEEEHEGGKRKGTTLSKILVQIILIDVVFSFDSILTAVGMTNGVEGAFLIMVIAVVISILIMMTFANPIRRFISKHPTLQILGLSFLLLIGFMLIAEGAHLSDAEVFNKDVGVIPKGYLYFSIFFSLLIEVINMKIQKRKMRKK
ncbi:TerC family protein [Aureivirga sp. CE67]|uniref:TerC family protein n=1 Tax=Aureivirga sp. CE67 TaxID=1788983 RepID=UPI0018CAC9D5|nr:TerC family protein [Aureivirga sp. CE67]